MKETDMKKFYAGFVTGIILLLVVGGLCMPMLGKLFFVEDQSVLSFDETVAKIRAAAEADAHWVIKQEKDFNKTYQKTGKGELPFRLTEFKLGNPDHSYRVNSAFPAVSTFMPAAIAVVEYAPDDVRIYRKNTGLMGCMFTGEVKKVMRNEVPQELDRILAGIIQN
jgi:uncharacterized protein (DUF302 family)